MSNTRPQPSRGAYIVRPGYIVGPLDHTDRFTYWPVRASRGGEMLAPGTPEDPIQIIDVRDLAAWMMHLVEARTNGYFNPFPRHAPSPWAGSSAPARVSRPRRTRRSPGYPKFFAAHWKAEELDLPPWAPSKGEFAGAGLTATDAASRSGLRCRPLAATVHDTLVSFKTLPPERQAKLRAGLDPKKEADTLRAWHQRHGGG